MEDEDLPSDEYRFVPARHVPGYELICPIVEVVGYAEDDDFHFLNPYTSMFSKAPLELTLTAIPTFLILELGLIDPGKEIPVKLAGEAVAAGIRAVFGPCGVTIAHERIRTVVELDALMSSHQFAGQFTHIIIIGHGNNEGLGFLSAGGIETVGGHQLAELLGCVEGCADCQIISLCCESGCSDVASELSKAPNITEVIGPSKSFPVNWAAPFISGYLLKLLSSGESHEEALQMAAQWCDETPMVIWRDGSKVS